MRAVLERDFLFEASRTRAVVLRTVLAGFVAAAVVLAVLSMSEEFRDNPDTVGIWLFRVGAGALLAMIALLAPPVVVGSVLGERMQETLPILLATPVGPYRFALAKILSRTGVIVFLAAAAVPALALTTVFGGVQGGQVADLLVLAAGLALELTAWALWFSTASKRLATAVVLSFVVPLARWGLLTLLFVWVQDALGGFQSERYVVPVLGSYATTPFPAIVDVMEPGSYAALPRLFTAAPARGSVGDLLLRYPALVYLLTGLLSAAAAVAAAGRRLRFEAEPKEGWLSGTRLGRRWFRRGSPGRNPVAWKELRLLNTASSRPLFYTVLGVLLLAEALLMKHTHRGEEAIALLASEVTLLCLLSAANGASILGQERTQGSYDLLRASPLTPGQILKGKAAGVFAGLLLLACVPVAHAFLCYKGGGLRLETALAVAFLALAIPWGWAAFGMATATHAPRIRTAVIRTMAAFAVCLVGLPVLGFLIAQASGWRSAGNAVGEWVVFTCPPACLFGVLDGVEDRRFRFSHGTWRARDEHTYSLFWILVYLALAAVLTLTLRRRLVRALERDREG